MLEERNSRARLRVKIGRNCLPDSIPGFRVSRCQARATDLLAKRTGTLPAPGEPQSCRLINYRKENRYRDAENDRPLSGVFQNIPQFIAVICYGGLYPCKNKNREISRRIDIAEWRTEWSIRPSK